jgi:RNA polymerase sigma-70 factor (ECF subfamily)
MVGVTRKRREAGGLRERRLSVNGRPGRVLVEPDQGIWGVLTIDVAEDVIQTVRIMRNPDKLRHLERWERGPGS